MNARSAVNSEQNGADQKGAAPYFLIGAAPGFSADDW
jgi:hypothetical protein